MMNVLASPTESGDKSAIWSYVMSTAMPKNDIYVVNLIRCL